MKLNKKHGGKEFNSYFRFVGQVKQTEKGMGEDKKALPIYQVTKTKTDKDRKVLQFDVVTAKNNNLSVQQAGMEFDLAYITSSSEKKTQSIKWADRFDKEKYPNKTYHLITTPWDLTEQIGTEIKVDDWVDVKGKYEFGTYTNEEDGKEYLVVKRIISSCEKIEDGQELKLKGKKTLNYVCDFDSPDFQEVNYFGCEIAIKSVYQDESNKDVTVNAVFLDYGKEKSTPRDVKLTVYHKEPAEGKKSLADSFAKITEKSFIEITGVDNNRPIFTLVENPEEKEDDVFGDIDDSEKTSKPQWMITGNKKGLEITGIVASTYQKDFLTEEEMRGEVDPFSEDDNDDSELPF